MENSVDVLNQFGEKRVPYSRKIIFQEMHVPAKAGMMRFFTRKMLQ